MVNDRTKLGSSAFRLWPIAVSTAAIGVVAIVLILIGNKGVSNSRFAEQGFPLSVKSQNSGPFLRATGESADASIILRNDSAAACQILSVERSCGCLEVDFPTARIASGADVIVGISSRSPSTGGLVHGWVDIRVGMDDGRIDQKKFSTELRFKQLIEIFPSSVRLHSKMQPTFNAVVVVRSTDIDFTETADFRVQCVGVPDLLNVTIGKNAICRRAVENYFETEFPLSISVSDQLVRGELRSTGFILDVPSASIRLPCLVDGRDGITLNPELVRFTKAKNECKVFVRAIDRRPFAITGVDGLNSSLNATWKSNSGEYVQILTLQRVTSDADAVPEILTIRTTHQEYGCHELRIQVAE